MESLQIIVAGLAAIILFVFGLDNFSTEIERITGERFRRFLGSATSVPVIGVAIGAVVTGVIQSSSATSVITISLVNAGVLSFKSSVGIIFGSNIGTTVTAQLVAFKLTAFAPVFVIAGFVLSLVRSRYSVFGKAVFYFGFVFFSLNLISSSLAPLQSSEVLMGYLTQPQNPLLAILAGCLFTAVVQSSSVTTGLAIIFVQQGILGLENAVPLIMGANVGTTATALIAVFQMDIAAKKTALSHFLFNTGGVILLAPLLFLYGDRLSGVEVDPALALAGLHLAFNLVTTILFLVFIRQFVALVDFLLGEGKMDFERLALPVFSQEATFPEISSALKVNSGQLFDFLRENYSLVTLAIEANYRSITEAAEKRIDYLRFVKRETTGYFTRVVTMVEDQNDIRSLLRTITLYDYLFQIHDSIIDLFEAKKLLDDQYIELHPDVLGLVRQVSTETLGFFDDISNALADDVAEASIEERSLELQDEIDAANRELLRLMIVPSRRDAGALANYITYSQRLKDKLHNYYHTAIRLGAPGAGAGQQTPAPIAPQ